MIDAKKAFEISKHYQGTDYHLDRIEKVIKEHCELGRYGCIVSFKDEELHYRSVIKSTLEELGYSVKMKPWPDPRLMIKWGEK